MGEFEERYNRLPETTKLYIKYMRGEYEPPRGKIEPPTTPRGLDQDMVFVDFDKHLLVKGIYHPKYKGIQYKGRATSGKQDWIYGDGEKPQRFSQIFQEILYSHFLKSCSKCKEIKIIEDFSKKVGAKYSFDQVCRKCNKEKRLKNKKQRRLYHSEYVKNKYHNDPIYNIHHSLRRNLNGFFRSKGKIKSERTLEYLGMSFEKFYDMKFPKSKINDKKWKSNIDHVIPLSLMTESIKRGILEESLNSRLVFALWHYSNLQIIDAHVNKHEKSDYHEGVRMRDKKDSELIFMINDLINKTEAIRQLDTKKAHPEE